MKIKFSTVRWLILTASFILLTFGVYIFGTRVNDYYIPTFVCPVDTQGIIGSSCYELSHMNEWLLRDISSGNFGAIIKFFAVLILFAVLFGRILCGFVCPFGFLQDLIDRLRQFLKIKPIRFTEKTNKWVAFFKWEIMAIFIAGCFIGINFCSFCPVILSSPGFAGIGTAIYVSGIIGIIVIASSFFKRRFWCNICPLGLLIGLASKISFFRLKKDCQACTECGACYEACPMGIKTIYTERKKTDITTCDCLMCGECIQKCPEDKALAFSIFKKKFYISSRKEFFNEQGLKKNKSASKNIDKLF